jgi:hypothetical protein
MQTSKRIKIAGFMFFICYYLFFTGQMPALSADREYARLIIIAFSVADFSQSWLFHFSLDLNRLPL